MKKDIPTHPWQIMSFAKDLFGLPFMRRLIGVNSDRQVYRQCTNPNMNYGDEPCPSFIERTGTFLTELKNTERNDADEAVYGTLLYLAEIGGYEVVKKGEHSPDKCMYGEIVDDSHTYAEAMNAIKAEKHPNVVKSLFSKHRDETKQTENRYSIDYFKDHKCNGCKYA